MDRRQFLSVLVGSATAFGAPGTADSPPAGRPATSTSPGFSVDVEAPDAVAPGEVVAVEVTATNEGTVVGTLHLRVEIDGEVVRRAEATLRPDQTHVATVQVPADDPGAIDWRAETQHDTEHGTIEVRSATGETNGSTTGETNGSATGESDGEAVNPRRAGESWSALPESETAVGLGVAVAGLGLLGRYVRGRR